MALLTTQISTILAELLQNVDFEETGSIAKAKRVVTLINQLMILRPASSSHSSSSNSYDQKYIDQIGNRARAYVAANDIASNSGATVYISPSKTWRGV